MSVNATRNKPNMYNVRFNRIFQVTVFLVAKPSGYKPGLLASFQFPVQIRGNSETLPSHEKVPISEEKSLCICSLALFAGARVGRKVLEVISSDSFNCSPSCVISVSRPPLHSKG